MKTPPNRLRPILDRLTDAGDDRFLFGAAGQVSLRSLTSHTSFAGRPHELSGRSILLTTRDQLSLAVALIELDGVARRLIICPPDIPAEQFPWIVAQAGVDAIVSDYELAAEDCPGLTRVACGCPLTPLEQPAESRDTEWVLLTSGTTGKPKMIVHSLASLSSAVLASQRQPSGTVWGTFYDIRRYGGLSVFFRAVLGGASLVLSSPAEPVGNHLSRLAARHVTHLLGTPSHWRRALMSPQLHQIAPRYVRLSGEIADPAILDALRAFFPQAAVVHAFATTEAGVAFEVTDGLAGFPADFIGRRGDVEMKIENDSLQIRSNRIASRYLTTENGPLADEDGFVDTGDILELRGDRYFFLGRRNGVINVGGFKVYPEEVEAIINRHPAVRMSIVRSRRNPLTGALVAAEVVLGDAPDPAGVQNEILEICRLHLPPYKIPASIRCVASLEIAPGGKLGRAHA
jgi:acyl-CoA synthetase (AMP-forming)/AMP-acid ligase II